MFAIAWRIQKFINEMFVSGWTFIIEEFIQLLRRGWQTCEIKAEAAGESAAIGFGGGSEIVLFEASENKEIDAVFDPGEMLYRWWDWAADRLQGPKTEALTAENLNDGIARVFPGIADSLRRIEMDQIGFRCNPRPGSAVENPFFEHSDIVAGQFFPGRHFEILFCMHHRLEKEAFAGFGRDKGGTIITAFKDCFP